MIAHSKSPTHQARVESVMVSNTVYRAKTIQYIIHLTCSGTDRRTDRLSRRTLYRRDVVYDNPD